MIDLRKKIISGVLATLLGVFAIISTGFSVFALIMVFFIGFAVFNLAMAFQY